MDRSNRVLVALTLVGALTMAACDEELPTETLADSSVESLEPGIHPMLMIPESTRSAGATAGTGDPLSDTPRETGELPGDIRDAQNGGVPGVADTVVVAVHLKRVEVEDALTSFQGELTYDRHALTLVGGDVPGPALGAWNETETGVVRFAGVTLDGLEDRQPVLVLRFLVTSGRIDAGMFRVAIEEVVSTAEDRDVTESVIDHDRPLLMRSVDELN